MNDLADTGRRRPAPETKERTLDVTIEGDIGEGKTLLTWLLINALETFGADVNVATYDTESDGGEAPAQVAFMRGHDHNLRPGQLRGLIVNINTKRVSRDPNEV